MNKTIKEWLQTAQKEIREIEQQYDDGLISDPEYNNRVAHVAIYYIAACNFDMEIWND